MLDGTIGTCDHFLHNVDSMRLFSIVVSIVVAVVAVDSVHKSARVVMQSWPRIFVPSVICLTRKGLRRRFSTVINVESAGMLMVVMMLVCGDDGDADAADVIVSEVGRIITIVSSAVGVIHTHLRTNTSVWKDRCIVNVQFVLMWESALFCVLEGVVMELIVCVCVDDTPVGDV